MLKRIAALLTIVLACSTLSGCAAFSKLLPVLTDIILATQDATLLVDRAEDMARQWFATHPDPAAELEVAKAVGATRNTLIAANKTASGASELSTEDYGAAFGDFRVAWTKMVAVFKAAGIGAGTFGAAPGEPIEQVLGTPLALRVGAPELAP